jgi:hypothetical protein
MLAASRTFTYTARTWSTPNRRFCAVERGTKTTSSRSPKPVDPLRSITPITVNWARWMRMVCPTGSWPGNRVSRTVCPSTATRARRRMSSSVKNAPSTGCQFRTCGKEGVTPLTLVVSLYPPATTCAVRLNSAATASTSGTDRWMARASSQVRVCTLPRPWPTRPGPSARPGSTVSRLVPRAVSCSSTLRRAPAPMLTVVTTAATPMMTPRVVRTDRRGLPPSARTATRTLASTLTRAPPRSGASGPGPTRSGRPGTAPRGPRRPPRRARGSPSPR